MSNYPQQFTKGDKKLVAVTSRMREFFRKSRLINKNYIDVSALNYEDLKEFRILLQEEIDIIAAQLNRARADAAMGQYADPTWYRNAETAKRMRGRYMLEIQLQMRKARLQAHQNRRKDGFYKNGITEQDWDGFFKIMKFLRKKAETLNAQTHP